MTPRTWSAGSRVLFLCTLVFLAGYALVSLKAWQEGERSPGRPTTYSAGIQGYKVLYLWLKNLGLRVERWEKPLKNLPSEKGVLLMIEAELGPAPGELKALEGWVRNGGVLFLLATPPNPYMKHFGFEAEGFLGKEQKGREEKVWRQPSPYIRGEVRMESKGHPALTSSRPETIFHVRDWGGNLMGVVKEGRGRVVAMADPHLFSNQSLAKGDHGRLALDLFLSHVGGGVLIIDEYHHGYGRATTVLGHILGSLTLIPFLQGMFVLLVLWAVKGRRFGSPRPPVEREYRSPMEFAEAMAHLYQRGEKREYSLSGLLQWIEDEAKRIHKDRDPRLQAALQNAKERIQRKTLSEKDLLEEARNLYLALERAKRGMVGDEEDHEPQEERALCRRS